MSEPAPSSSSQAHLDLIARETGIRPASVAATAKLHAEGATIPFISRATGSPFP